MGYMSLKNNNRKKPKITILQQLGFSDIHASLSVYDNKYKHNKRKYSFWKFDQN